MSEDKWCPENDPAYQAEVAAASSPGNSITAAQSEIARLTAALAQSRAETQAALAGCVKVKPLVWEPVSSKIWDAVGSSCLYRVTWRDDGTAWLHTPLNGTIKYPSPNDAIVAAESLHKNDLLAAIQPDTSKLALVREALRFYAGCYEPEFSNPNSGPWGANSTDFGEKARAALALALITEQEGK